MYSFLLHDLIQAAATRTPQACALVDGERRVGYAELAQQTRALASALTELAMERAARIAIYLDKRVETVVASFGAAAAGAVFVPVNPVLKPTQLAYILRDSQARVLVTSVERWSALQPALADCADLRHVILIGGNDPLPLAPGLALHRWSDLLQAPARRTQRVIDADMAAILYTSGSTGQPKGVVLSHRNMVCGAHSVSSYLENNKHDVLLAALPLSFDAGFSQLTTAFHVGAQVVLLNYLMPRDVLQALLRHRVTGLTAVPPLWIQLSKLPWPETASEHLRYFANTGGHMPQETLTRLRQALPAARPYLMYGLTEAFRASYLDPAEVDRRPDSIGKAIPNAEILVLREDGTPCAPNEPGELVQRGALVAQGYWNDPAKTAERFRPLPGRERGLVLPEMAVFSGDTVRMDEEGFLYFMGRRDEMIKTSGYRVSPSEVEEIVYATGMVGECVALGVAHDVLGQTIGLIATPAQGAILHTDALLKACRQRMPAYMVPARIEARQGSLPRNPNGKIDRRLLASQWAAAEVSA